MCMIMSVPEHCLISYLKYLNMQFTWTAKGLMISLEALFNDPLLSRYYKPLHDFKYTSFKI